LVKGGRIKAGGNSDLASVIEDQFEGRWNLADMMINGRHERSGADMNRQEGRRIGLHGRR
jgi:hypothetical protein